MSVMYFGTRKSCNHFTLALNYDTMNSNNNYIIYDDDMLHRDWGKPIFIIALLKEG